MMWSLPVLSLRAWRRYWLPLSALLFGVAAADFFRLGNYFPATLLVWAGLLNAAGGLLLRYAFRLPQWIGLASALLSLVIALDYLLHQHPAFAGAWVLIAVLHVWVALRTGQSGRNRPVLPLS